MLQRPAILRACQTLFAVGMTLAIAWISSSASQGVPRGDATTSPATQRGATWTLDEGGVVRGDRTRRRLALIFTGGDHAEGVPTIVRVCEARGVPAAFFVTGDFLRQHEAAARSIVTAGHFLGPHGDQHLLYAPWDDRQRSLVTERPFKADLQRNLSDLAAVGSASPTYFVPPYEWYNAQHVGWAAELGLTLVNFTPGSGSNRDYIPESDAKFRSSAQLLADILAYEARDPDGLNGFLLLLHAGSTRRDKMHDRLDELVGALQRRGYEFVTLATLLEEPDR